MESLKVKLAEELMEYAEEYINEFTLYFNSPNRKNLFPYIYRVLLAGNDISKIKSLFPYSIKLENKIV